MPGDCPSRKARNRIRIAIGLSSDHSPIYLSARMQKRQARARIFQTARRLSQGGRL